ncbi:MAG: hypothetical protein LBF15_00030 [Candidatus Peribacteria bacterium]|jgi:hypothetical protein|nr:hypothetical protein [Candidatus Peribacteria bacterium]
MQNLGVDKAYLDDFENQIKSVEDWKNPEIQEAIRGFLKRVNNLTTLLGTNTPPSEIDRLISLNKALFYLAEHDEELRKILNPELSQVKKQILELSLEQVGNINDALHQMDINRDLRLLQLRG